MLFTKLMKKSPNLLWKMRNSVHAFRNYKNVAFEDIPPGVSVSIIKKTLKSNGLNYEDGFTCLLIPCKVCKKGEKRGKTYVNKTTGMYMCSCCKAVGDWNDLLLLLLSKKDKTSKCRKQQVASEMEIIRQVVENISTSTSKLELMDEPTIGRMMPKFSLPVISQSSLSNLDVRIDESKSSLYFPLENVESEIVGFRKITSGLKEDTILPDIKYGGLLTARTARKNKDTAVLIPNIADFLILLDAGIGTSIVCLPNGVNNLPQYCLPSLERFKKIILWLGNDNQSWDASRHFARKLGEKRCLLIRPTETQVLPHLDISQDFKSIIHGAQQMWHKSVTTFSTLRPEVLSDLMNIDKVQGVKWKRFSTLNRILKGHRRGELTIITGPTGSGKTTFISEYSLDLAMQGVNTLWGSFEIRNARLAKTMLQQMAGFPLDEHLDLFDLWADQFEKLPVYFMTFHGQQAIKVVMETVQHATYVYDIAHVVIDNVQFMMGMSEEQRHMDRFWKQDTIIAAFREFATRKNCHVTLVIHPRKERDDEDLTTSSIFGGAKASQEADNVLIVQDKRLTSIRGKKFLQIAKNRYSGDLGIMTLDFDKSSLSYQQKKPKEKKAANDPNMKQEKDET